LNDKIAVNGFSGCPKMLSGDGVNIPGFYFSWIGFVILRRFGGTHPGHARKILLYYIATVQGRPSHGGDWQAFIIKNDEDNLHGIR
jgi:hypothetical protein